MSIKSFFKRKVLKPAAINISKAARGDLLDEYVNDFRFNTAYVQSADDKTKATVAAQLFYNKNHVYPNILEPKTFSEKKLWLKLFYHDDRIPTCIDKYNAKAYIDSVLGPGYTVPVLKKYESVYDINLDELPEKFVLKVNWRTGYNIVVTDKSSVDIEATRAKLDLWCLPWKSGYAGSFNWGYSKVEPIVFAEEYVDIANNPVEYKILCFNGKPEIVMLELDCKAKKRQRAYYDCNFNELPFKFGSYDTAHNLQKPKTFETMLELAQKLADPFPYVRIDFYDIAGKLYVGEMTFYTGGGLTKITPQKYDRILGDKLDLTDAMARMEQEKTSAANKTEKED